MRGLYSSKTEIRHKIFTEIARMAYEGQSPEMLEELPYKIVPGEIATYRDSIFLERAVVGERLRVAMGMSLRKVTEHAPISKGVEASVIEEKYYEPPLINVIKFACNSCPEKRVMITEGCQGCLEHPCVEVCPKKAVHMEGGRSHIDEDACIKCGKCLEACPYNAIIKQERPCSKACGMNAIGSDEYGRAEIDQDKCVSCGQCLVSCPFSAIVDKGQIFQTVMALKSETPVYAIVAPAIAGQFPADFPAAGYPAPDFKGCTKPYNKQRCQSRFRKAVQYYEIRLCDLRKSGTGPQQNCHPCTQNNNEQKTDQCFRNCNREMGKNRAVSAHTAEAVPDHYRTAEDKRINPSPSGRHFP